MNKFRKTLVVVFSALFLLCTALFAVGCDLGTGNNAEAPEAPKSAYSVSVDVNDASLGNYTLTAANYGEEYTAGTPVTVTVEPNEGYEAALKVNGEEVALANNAYTFAIDADTTVEVSYTYKYTVTTYVSGGEGEIVLSKPASGTQYKENEEVTVTPTAKEGSAVSALWVNGDPVELTEGVYKFNITGKTYVVAEFVALYDLTVINNGSLGKIALTADRQPVNQTPTKDLKAGTLISLTVTPVGTNTLQGVYMNGALLPLAQDGTASFTLNADTTIEVVYDTYYNVTLPEVADAMGFVSLDKEVGEKPGYLAGTALTLIVEAQDGYVVSSVTMTVGDDEPVPVELIGGRYTFEIAGNTTFAVEFKPYEEVLSYSVSLACNNNGYGEASIALVEDTGSKLESGEYTYGSELTVTATAKAGYKFSYITVNGARVNADDLTETDGTYSCTVTVTGETSIFVCFVKAERYTVRLEMYGLKDTGVKAAFAEGVGEAVFDGETSAERKFYAGQTVTVNLTKADGALADGRKVFYTVNGGEKQIYNDEAIVVENIAGNTLISIFAEEPVKPQPTFGTNVQGVVVADPAGYLETALEGGIYTYTFKADPANVTDNGKTYRFNGWTVKVNGEPAEKNAAAAAAIALADNADEAELFNEGDSFSFAYSNDPEEMKIEIEAQWIELVAVTLPEAEGANGKVTLAPQATEGYYDINTPVTITVTPNEGYRVKSVTLTFEGEDATVKTNASVGAYALQDLALKANLTVAVEYQKVWTVSASAEAFSENATFTVAPAAAEAEDVFCYFDEAKGVYTVDDGVEYTITVKAKDGNLLTKVVVNIAGGQPVGFTAHKSEDDYNAKAEFTYTLSGGFKANITLEAETLAAHTLTLDYDGAEEAENVTLKFVKGDKYTLPAKPVQAGYTFKGYEIADEEGYKAAGTELTLEETDVAITAVWAYTVNATAGENGTVTLDPEQTEYLKSEGKTITVTVAAAKYYKIKTLTVTVAGSEEFDADTAITYSEDNKTATFELTPEMGNATIAAEFEKLMVTVKLTLNNAPEGEQPIFKLGSADGEDIVSGQEYPAGTIVYFYTEAPAGYKQVIKGAIFEGVNLGGTFNNKGKFSVQRALTEKGLDLVIDYYKIVTVSLKVTGEQPEGAGFAFKYTDEKGDDIFAEDSDFAIGASTTLSTDTIVYFYVMAPEGYQAIINGAKFKNFSLNGGTFKNVNGGAFKYSGLLTDEGLNLEVIWSKAAKLDYTFVNNAGTTEGLSFTYTENGQTYTVDSTTSVYLAVGTKLSLHIDPPMGYQATVTGLFGPGKIIFQEGSHGNFGNLTLGENGLNIKIVYEHVAAITYVLEKNVDEALQGVTFTYGADNTPIEPGKKTYLPVGTMITLNLEPLEGYRVTYSGLVLKNFTSPGTMTYWGGTKGNVSRELTETSFTLTLLYEKMATVNYTVELPESNEPETNVTLTYGEDKTIAAGKATPLPVGTKLTLTLNVPEGYKATVTGLTIDGHEDGVFDGANKPYTAELELTAEGLNFTATYQVTKQYPITITANHAVVTFTGENIPENETEFEAFEGTRFTMSVRPAVGYTLTATSATMNGEPLEGTPAENKLDYTYTFTVGKEAVEIVITAVRELTNVQFPEATPEQDSTGAPVQGTWEAVAEDGENNLEIGANTLVINGDPVKSATTNDKTGGEVVYNLTTETNKTYSLAWFEETEGFILVLTDTTPAGARLRAAARTAGGVTYYVNPELGDKLHASFADGDSAKFVGTWTDNLAAGETLLVISEQEGKIALTLGEAEAAYIINATNGQNSRYFVVMADGTAAYVLTAGEGTVLLDENAYSPKLYKVTMAENENAVFAVVEPAESADGYKVGATVKFTVTANEGYEIVSVKNGDVELQAEEGKYSVTIENADIIITVETRAVFTVTLTVNGNTEGDGNSATLDKTGPVPTGTTVTLTVVTAAGYTATVTIDGTGVELNEEGKYEINVTKNIEVVVTFAATAPSPEKEITKVSGAVIEANKLFYLIIDTKGQYDAEELQNTLKLVCGETVMNCVGIESIADPAGRFKVWFNSLIDLPISETDYVVTLKVDKTDIVFTDLTDGADTSKTFVHDGKSYSLVAEDGKLSVHVEAAQFTVTVNESGKPADIEGFSYSLKNGEDTVENNGKVPANATLTLTVTVPGGYQATVVVSGATSEQSGEGYTIKNLTDNVTITITYTKEGEPTPVAKVTSVAGAIVEDGGFYIVVNTENVTNADQLKANLKIKFGTALEKEFTTADSTAVPGQYKLFFNCIVDLVSGQSYVVTMTAFNETFENLTEGATTNNSLTLGDKVFTLSVADGKLTLTVAKDGGEPQPQGTIEGPTDVDLIQDAQGVWLVVKGTFEGYDEAGLKAALTKYGCDLQELSGVISGEPEDWSRQGRLSQAIIADNITVSGAEWSVRFSLLNLKIYAYCLHFGPTASNPEDVKIEGVHEKSVEYDGRKYSLINKYGSTTQPEYWGCVGLRIENIATAATVTATSANLEATDSAVYFVLSGTYQNIDADKIEDLLKTVYFDFQERDGSWTVYTFDRTVSVEGNNWTIKFDITKLPVNANAFTGHFLPALENNTANAGENLTLTTEQLPDGTITATVGAKKYTLVNKHGSGEATDNWGCVSVKVEDAVVVTDKYVISKDTIEKAELVQEDGKAYFVVTTNAGTASNGYTLEELATTKVGNIDGSTHVLYDCTSAKIVDGKLVLKFELTQSAKQNELYMNLYKSDEQKITDINEAVTVSSIAVNGKAFSIKNTQEYNSILLTVAPDFTIDYTKIQVTEEGGKPVLKIEGTVGTSITDATYMGFDLQSTTGSWPRVQDLDYTIAVAQGKFTVTVQLSSLDFLGGDGYIMHMYAGGKAEGTGVITIDVEDKESKLTSTDVTIDCVRYVVNRHTMWNTRPMVTLTVENVHTIQNGVCVICGKVCNHEGQTGTTCSKCGATLVSGSDYTKDENVVEFGTWVDIPVELTKGNQVIMYGTQTTTMTDTVAEKEGAANPTFGQPVNHGTVIWECKEGYTGRFDNYGWQFNVTNFTGTMTGITLAVFDAQGNFATGDVWTLYQDICKDSRWVVRIAYASDYVLSVYIAVTANSGEHAGYTYVDAYDVHIAAAQAKYTFHVTGGSTGGLTKFAVTGHQTAAFTGRTDTYASLPTWPTFVRSTDLVKGGSVTLEATLDSFGADDKGTQNWLTAVARLNVVNAENAFFFRADGIGHFPWLEDGSSWHGANIDNQSITISNAAYIVSSKPSGDLSYETFVGGIVTMTFSLDVNGTLSFSYTLTKGETTYSYSGTISTLTAPSYGLDFAVDGGTLSNITITTTYAQA